MSLKNFLDDWLENTSIIPSNLMWLLTEKLKTSSETLNDLIFTKDYTTGNVVYKHMTHTIHFMPETVAHRILRSNKKSIQPIKLQKSIIKIEHGEDVKVTTTLLPEHLHTPRPQIYRHCQPTLMPRFLWDTIPKVITSFRKIYICNCTVTRALKRQEECGDEFIQRLLWLGCELADNMPLHRAHARIVLPTRFSHQQIGGLTACKPITGWSNILVPGKKKKFIIDWYKINRKIKFFFFYY